MKKNHLTPPPPPPPPGAIWVGLDGGGGVGSMYITSTKHMGHVRVCTTCTSMDCIVRFLMLITFALKREIFDSLCILNLSTFCDTKFQNGGRKIRELINTEIREIDGLKSTSAVISASRKHFAKNRLNKIYIIFFQTGQDRILELHLSRDFWA